MGKPDVQYLIDLREARGEDVAALRAIDAIESYQADVTEAKKKLVVIQAIAEKKFNPEAYLKDPVKAAPEVSPVG